MARSGLLLTDSTKKTLPRLNFRNELARTLFLRDTTDSSDRSNIHLTDAVHINIKILHMGNHEGHICSNKSKL